LTPVKENHIHIDNSYFPFETAELEIYEWMKKNIKVLWNNLNTHIEILTKNVYKK